MYALVKGLIARKVPIDGVGFQTHISNSFYTQIPSMEANLKRFAALGLDIHITELDVRACSDSSTCDDKALARQGEVYEGLLRMCLRIASCKVFEMWGFTDRHTWTRTFHNPTRKDEMPLPFDSSYQAKPAFYSMLKALNGSAPVPPPSPTPSHHYITQTTTCKNAKPISGLLRVSSVRECEQHCDEDAACIAVDTNGAQCYTKGSCDGTAGDCEGWCSYKKAR